MQALKSHPIFYCGTGFSCCKIQNSKQSIQKGPKERALYKGLYYLETGPGILRCLIGQLYP